LSAPFLSLVIPAYNEERRLPGTLEQALNFLHKQPYSFEILVMENASQDGTLQIATQFAQEHPQVRACHDEQGGKGRAVQRGMLAAQGEYCFMFDADSSMPVDQINRFFPPILEGYDIAIGSREASGAVRYQEPPYRHLGGRAVNTMIRVLALPGLQDTQCGFKCFRREVVQDLFKFQTMPGFSFDVELLYIARRRRYRIAEIPIPWYYNTETKVRVFQDTLRMGLDLLKIRWNGWKGVYDPL
jgi:glycosyltransferase involved in cell wall biosynthesis